MKRPLSMRRLGAVVLLSMSVWPGLGRGEEVNASIPPGWLVNTWAGEDGLPSGVVYAVTQTPDGFLWLGMPQGLVRFDGVRAVVVGENTPAGALRNTVTALYVDRKGMLWLGRKNGSVARLERDGHLREVVAGSSRGSAVVSIREDEHGCYWFGLTGGWLRMDDHGDRTHAPVYPGVRATDPFHFTHDAQGRLWGVSGNTLFRMENDELKPVFNESSLPIRAGPARSGGFWLAHQKKLYRFTPGDSPREISPLDPLTGAAEIAFIHEDREGRLWVGSVNKGMFLCVNGRLENVPVNHEILAAVFEDREGNIWSGSLDNGLSRIRPRVFHTLDTAAGLPSSAVMAVCVDGQGAVYAAGWRWLARYDRGRFASAQDGRGQAVAIPGTVHALCALPDGGLALGTENDGLYLWRGKDRCEFVGLRGVYISALLPSSKGGLWVAARGQGLAYWHEGVLTQYEGTQHASVSTIMSLAEDRMGRLWVGTIRGALGVFKDGRIVMYEPQDGHPPQSLLCLWPNPDGSIWAGVSGGGLLLFDQGRFTRVTTEHGLHSDSIHALHADEHGQVWCGSGHGLFRVPRAQIEAFAKGQRKEVEAFFYGRGEGLDGPVFNPGLYAQRQTPDGQLWFATRSGLVTFNPRMIKTGGQPLPVYLDTMRVNGKAVNPAPGASAQRLKLPPGVNSIEFAFTSPALTAPERIKLYYRLEGWDAEWLDGSGARRASYGRLPPGNYRFRVIARDHEGGWNRGGATQAFHVQPAFWQTFWFLGGLALTAAGLLFAAIRYFYQRRFRARAAEWEREQALMRERERIAADLHDDVGASLTRIAQLGELARVHAGGGAPPQLDQIARAARHTIEIMDEIVWTMNPRNDSVSRLIGYASDYAAEFVAAGGLQLRTDLPENPPEIKITSDVRHHVLMAVKEALNNAVKHAQARSISLRITVHPGELRMVVSDDGRGFVPAHAGGGAGLGNLHQRLRACGGTLRIESQPGQGTAVVISLPLRDTP